MTEKKITRKIISKVPVKEKGLQKEQVSKASEVSKVEIDGTGKTRKVCFFDQSKTEPNYTDIVTLKRFINDRAKITSALKSHLCSKHQRVVTRQIKYARHLALLPFIPRV